MLQATAEANNLAAQASAFERYNREMEEVGLAIINALNICWCCNYIGTVTPLIIGTNNMIIH